MQNQNFIRGNEQDAVATVVIRQLADLNFVSREMEEAVADEWEKTHGRLVRRSYETQAEWNLRVAVRESMPVPSRPQLVMAPERAKSELQRLERATRSYPPSPQEQSQMNELRDVLHIPRIDYVKGKVVVSEEQKLLEVIESRFKKFQAGTEKQRLNWAKASTNPEWLAKIASCDESELVRNAAVERLAGITDITVE